MSGLHTRVRRWFARLLSVSLVLAGAGAGVVLMSGVADAHTGSMTASAVCDTATGTYTVTYAGTTGNVPTTGSGHSADLSITTFTPAAASITSFTTPVVGNGSTFTIKQSVPGNATSASVTAKLLWGDNNQASPQGSIELSGTCTHVVTPVAPTATASQCTGPGSHGNGAIVFPTPLQTGIGHWVLKQGSTVLNGNVTTGSVSLAPGSYTAIAVAADGYSFGENQSSFTVVVSDAGSCVVTVTPVAPTASAESCTGPGSHVNGALVFPGTLQTGIGHWVITQGQTVVNGNVTTGSVSLPAGSYTATAVAADGYSFGDHTSSFPLTVNGAGACLVQVTPVAPSATAESCTGPGTHGNGALVFPATLQTGIDHWVITQGQTVVNANVTTGSVSLPAGDYTATAVAASGYGFGDHASSFPLTVNGAGSCTVFVSVIGPAAAPASCTGPGTQGNGMIDLGDAQTGVAGWVISQGDTVIASATSGVIQVPAGDYLVLASPQPGYSFGENQSGFVVTVDSAGTCVLGVVFVNPALSQATCTKTATEATLHPATYTLPGVTGVEWFVNGAAEATSPGTYAASAGALTIVAQALEGYQLGNDGIRTQQFDLTVDKAPTCVLGTKITKPVNKPVVLPFTGYAAEPVLELAGLLMFGGLGLAFAGRRRKGAVTLG